MYGGLGDDGLLVKLNAVCDAGSLLAPDSLLLNALGRYVYVYICVLNLHCTYIYSSSHYLIYNVWFYHR